MFKDDHLLPPIIKDLCETLMSTKIRENERAYYYQRVEAIKQACEKALELAGKHNGAFRK